MEREDPRAKRVAVILDRALWSGLAVAVIAWGCVALRWHSPEAASSRIDSGPAPKLAPALPVVWDQEIIPAGRFRSLLRPDKPPAFGAKVVFDELRVMGPDGIPLSIDDASDNLAGDVDVRTCAEWELARAAGACPLTRGVQRADIDFAQVAALCRFLYRAVPADHSLFRTPATRPAAGFAKSTFVTKRDRILAYGDVDGDGWQDALVQRMKATEEDPDAYPWIGVIDGRSGTEALPMDRGGFAMSWAAPIAKTTVGGMTISLGMLPPSSLHGQKAQVLMVCADTWGITHAGEWITPGDARFGGEDTEEQLRRLFGTDPHAASRQLGAMIRRGPGGSRFIAFKAVNGAATCPNWVLHAYPVEPTQLPLGGSFEQASLAGEGESLRIVQDDFAESGLIVPGHEYLAKVVLAPRNDGWEPDLAAMRRQPPTEAEIERIARRLRESWHGCSAPDCIGDGQPLCGVLAEMIFQGNAKAAGKVLDRVMADRPDRNRQFIALFARELHDGTRHLDAVRRLNGGTLGPFEARAPAAEDTRVPRGP